MVDTHVTAEEKQARCSVENVVISFEMIGF